MSEALDNLKCKDRDPIVMDKMIIPAFVNDGEGFGLGIFVMDESEIHELQDPYTAEYLQFSDLKNPTDVVDELRAETEKAIKLREEQLNLDS